MIEQLEKLLSEILGFVPKPIRVAILVTAIIVAACTFLIGSWVALPSPWNVILVLVCAFGFAVVLFVTVMVFLKTWWRKREMTLVAVQVGFGCPKLCDVEGKKGEKCPNCGTLLVQRKAIQYRWEGKAAKRKIRPLTKRERDSWGFIEEAEKSRMGS